MMEDVKAGRISGLTNPQGFIHKLAPCRVTLRGRKSRTGHAENSKTLGEHLYRARFDSGLAQPQVAEAIRCPHHSPLNCERYRKTPQLRYPQARLYKTPYPALTLSRPLPRPF